jgi:hypothetical protein
MLRTLGAVSIVVSGVAIGCSGHGGGLSPSQYTAEAAQALCDYEVRCGLFADQAGCLAFGQTAPDATLQPLLDSGKATFDGVAAQACLDAISTVPCDQTQMAARVVPDACSRFVRGTVAMGGACEQNAECQSGACDVPDCGSACCSGTCGAAQAPGGSGDPCATRACDAGLACSTASDTCVPLAGSGAGCTLPSDCDYGLGCAGGICQPLPAVGQPCAAGQCADVGAVCNASGTCVMLGLPGAPCTTAADCSPYATCDVANGTCAALPTAGQACTTECSDGSYCNGTCMVPGSDGAPCTRDGQCASRYCGGSACAPAPVCI